MTRKTTFCAVALEGIACKDFMIYDCFFFIKMTALVRVRFRNVFIIYYNKMCYYLTALSSKVMKIRVQKYVKRHTIITRGKSKQKESDVIS